MKKSCLVILVVISLSLGCSNAKKESSKIEIVQDYIEALNNTDYYKTTSFFLDSIRMKEMDYISVFSKKDYYKLFQWDSIFQPTYQILDIKEKGSAVHVKISKEGQRILFLNEKPVITEEVVQFKEGKIVSINIVNYVFFNDETWNQKRAALISWVEKNEPELNGFIHDQTKQGALNYLNAIKLYLSDRQP